LVILVGWDCLFLKGVTGLNKELGRVGEAGRKKLANKAKGKGGKRVKQRNLIGKMGRAKGTLKEVGESV